ncbi:MAG: bifunctional phosphopantothenoylcysteine decarboxylase/phosphopantothenate--cysteine ligase CoaBC [Nevskiaceae bacterium]|nr:MAG: bifunctional phosphopantothenoylcysteine decarboxylase/phosphopantothenate--cysteine ligase CoaBC [Nevskiaceae bacterium]TBR72786.1 MAG: bifunctional phosphopantothenoylcysteine decarboxylase/phosphopantothenate--cysteine ligase CoaBC [Nevskiaceae bacterium]
MKLRENANTIPQRVLLIVTAGIAAYKAAELVRALVKRGVDVQVVTTAGVAHFVGHATFQALSGHPVRDSLWDAQAEAAMGHIELARWADAVVVAPATANFIARLAHGFADDLATTLCLASDRPLWVAPAMNRLMWANTATQANVALLRSRGVHITGPASGEQACGEVGAGRMAEPEAIAEAVLGRSDSESPISKRQSRPLVGKHAVVTAGPTREAIDPVRFLSNPSSGKQGFAVAQALLDAGAEVTLIAGPVQRPTPSGVRRIDVTTAKEMCAATLAACEHADLLVGTAAVADFHLPHPAPQKIKKSSATPTLTLELVHTPDIISTVRKAQPQLFIAGFAAETENLAANAHKKIARKGLDLIAANSVAAGRAFSTDDNELHVYWPGGERLLPRADKATLAAALVAVIAERFAAQPTHAAP